MAPDRNIPPDSFSSRASSVMQRSKVKVTGSLWELRGSSVTYTLPLTEFAKTTFNVFNVFKTNQTPTSFDWQCQQFLIAPASFHPMVGVPTPFVFWGTKIKFNQVLEVCLPCYSRGQASEKSTWNWASLFCDEKIHCIEKSMKLWKVISQWIEIVGINIEYSYFRTGVVLPHPHLKKLPLKTYITRQSKPRNFQQNKM